MIQLPVYTLLALLLLRWLQWGHTEQNSVTNKAGSSSASHVWGSSAPLGTPSSESAQRQERMEPTPRLSHQADQSPDYWMNEAGAAMASVLKTLPTKVDSTQFEAEREKFSSLHPWASRPPYPGCNTHCVILWMHSLKRLWLITWQVLRPSPSANLRPPKSAFCSSPGLSPSSIFQGTCFSDSRSNTLQYRHVRLAKL